LEGLILKAKEPAMAHGREVHILVFLWGAGGVGVNLGSHVGSLAVKQRRSSSFQVQNILWENFTARNNDLSR